MQCQASPREVDQRIQFLAWARHRSYRSAQSQEHFCRANGAGRTEAYEDSPL